MEKQRMENIICKCKSSCSKKRKSADSNRGCPCKARNTECSAECRCGARSKPCINKVLYIRVTIIYLPISNVELGILSQNICVFFPNQDNAHLLAEERGLRRRNQVRFGSDSSHAATEEEDRRREHNDVKVYYSWTTTNNWSSHDFIVLFSVILIWSSQFNISLHIKTECEKLSL